MRQVRKVGAAVMTASYMALLAYPSVNIEQPFSKGSYLTGILVVGDWLFCRLLEQEYLQQPEERKARAVQNNPDGVIAVHGLKSSKPSRASCLQQSRDIIRDEFIPNLKLVPTHHPEPPSRNERR